MIFNIKNIYNIIKAVSGRLKAMSGRLMTLQHAHRPATSCNEIFHVNPSRRYLLISPCRDEARYLRRTLDSVASQSVPPVLWVVEDDGSTDETPTILKEYARRLPYLRVVRRTDRNRREVGRCKQDMDLDLPVRYFELPMQRMDSDPCVGS